MVQFISFFTADNLRIIFVWCFVIMAADTLYRCCRYLPSRRPAPVYLHIHKQGNPAGSYISAPMMKTRVTVSNSGFSDVRFYSKEPIRFYLDHIGKDYQLQLQEGKLFTEVQNGTIQEGESFTISGFVFSIRKEE